MRALTLTQPWATLVALGHKQVETRSWRAVTVFQRTIAIHAAKSYPAAARAFARRPDINSLLPQLLPFGAIIAVAKVRNYVSTEWAEQNVTQAERAMGDYRPGRWAWFLENVVRLPNPIFCNGALGVWRLDEQLESALNSELRLLHTHERDGGRLSSMML